MRTVGGPLHSESKSRRSERIELAPGSQGQIHPHVAHVLGEDEQPLHHQRQWKIPSVKRLTDLTPLPLDRSRPAQSRPAPSSKHPGASLALGPERSGGHSPLHVRVIPRDFRLGRQFARHQRPLPSQHSRHRQKDANLRAALLFIWIGSGGLFVDISQAREQ